MNRQGCARAAPLPPLLPGQEFFAYAPGHKLLLDNLTKHGIIYGSPYGDIITEGKNYV